jgi:MFS family permease
MALVALLLYVKDVEESGLAVGLLLAAMSVPVLVTGPLAGTLADRTDSRRLMIACDLGRAGIYAAIAAALPSFPVLLGFVVAASVLTTLFAPAGRSSVPSLVGAGELQRANAWLSTATNLQVVLGPLLGGVLAGSVGIQATLGVNAGTFVASAVLLVGLPPLRRAGGEPATFLADVRAGLEYVARHRAARAVMVTLFLGVGFAAVDNVALVFLARDVFDAGPVGFGGLAAAFGVGMLLASLALVSGRLHVAPLRLFLIATFVCGAGTLLTGLAPLLGAAVAFQALAGAGNAGSNVATDTLVQQTVAPHMLARVFALVMMGAVAGSSIAALAGGVVLDLTSPRAVFVIGGGGMVAVAALAWWLLRAFEDVVRQER